MAGSTLVKVPDCDVLAIGGGPAGSIEAALLAGRGYRVTLLEQLWVADAVEVIGMEKWGAEFISPRHAHKQSLEFADATDTSAPMVWQMRRYNIRVVDKVMVN